MTPDSDRRAPASWGGPALLLAPWAALLLWQASRFDFVCDDAFIALRYARTWAESGSPVYNPGERVEGFTSFLFTAAVALLCRLGVEPVSGARLIGGASAVGLVAAQAALMGSLWPARPRGAIVAGAALLALSAPVAAWSLGGLETPLFAALTSLGLALVIQNFSTDGGPRRQAAAGLVLGLAALARPEGALFFGVAWLTSAALALRERSRLRGLLAFSLGFVALALPFEAWRWWYFGQPLPNTFYVKSTGAGPELWARGLRYAGLAAREMNPALLAAGALGLLWPGAGRAGAAALWMLRLLVAAGLAYVLRVGGDFLDLYRFFVPFYPLLLAGALRPLAALEAQATGRRGLGLAAALGLLAAAGHGWHQRQVAARALQIAEPERAARHLEPLGWTREFALRWAAAGRWIAAHARPGDTMAVGAAGAMPYFARLPSLDLFGLCDAHVARHGLLIGTRPGHQRFAPDEYIVDRDPTFLVLHAEAIGPHPTRLSLDPRWTPRGWVWAEAALEPTTHGAPSPLFFRFLLRRDRALEWRDLPGLRLAEDNPR